MTGGSRLSGTTSPKRPCHQNINPGTSYTFQIGTFVPVHVHPSYAMSLPDLVGTTTNHTVPSIPSQANGDQSH
jgi:hypothetical protein